MHSEHFVFIHAEHSHIVLVKLVMFVFTVVQGYNRYSSVILVWSYSCLLGFVIYVIQCNITNSCLTVNTTHLIIIHTLFYSLNRLLLCYTFLLFSNSFSKYLLKISVQLSFGNNCLYYVSHGFSFFFWSFNICVSTFLLYLLNCGTAVCS